MADIYVSKAGHDGTGDGSLANPYKTIKKAYDESSEGNEIQILDSGIYQVGGPDLASDRVFLTTNVSFTVASGQFPTIDGTSARSIGRPAFHGSTGPGGKTVSFTGFTFDSFTGSSNPICDQAQKIALQFNQCIFKNMNNVPIFSNPPEATSASPNMLNRSEVRSTTHFTVIGGNTGTDKHFLFKNSIFHHTASSANVSYVDSGDGSHTNAIMRNCSLLTTHDGNLGGGGAAIIRFGVIENTILRNLGGGDQTVGINAASSRSNNCTFGNFLTQQTGGTNGGNNLTSTNPLFVDESSPTGRGGGLKLQSGSPCIGAGKTIASVTVDFDGTSRFVPYDMGAYQAAAPAFTADGSETSRRKFGSREFLLNATANKLATRGFIDDRDNRQAPFSVTVAGPQTIRKRTTPYKNET
tara:strand:- start:71 stop:1303 length:1233 start_codon:yes stop_codon:yes gene_type:complete